MKICEQCLEGGDHYFGYTPICAWKDKDRVQWGQRGIAIESDGKHTGYVYGAFFEAFPAEYNTYFRGEGISFEVAEREAFQEYTRILACPSHEWDRKGRTDGWAVCKLCDLGMSDALEPLTKCAVCSKPTAYESHKVDDTKYYVCRYHSQNATNLLEKDALEAYYYIKEKECDVMRNEKFTTIEGDEYTVIDYLIRYPQANPDPRSILPIDFVHIEMWIDTNNSKAFFRRKKDQDHFKLPFIEE